MYWYRISFQSNQPPFAHTFMRQFRGKNAARNFALTFWSRCSGITQLRVEYMQFEPTYGSYFARCDIFTRSLP